jgi:serine/threonine-protein phosphatase PGAM5
VLLIRHGQYHLDTDEQGLTELGRLQSKKTGERLREWAEGVKEDRYGKTKVKISRVVCSDVPRARQSAEIIAAELGMEIAEVDPVLAEGTPCLHFPGAERQLRSTGEARLLRDSARIEYAFRKYCHRSCDLSTPRKMQEVTEAYSGRQVDEKVEKDAAVTYEVVVCHMNVIRYFVLRALQLPPEAWLRLRGDNGGITELIFYPEGKVSLSRFADTGHLGIAEMTFH